VPTAEGEALCERAIGLLAGFAAMEAELQERQKEPVGRIRLAATFGFGRLWLGPHWPTSRRAIRSWKCSCS
jgi:LysR family transcriptional activator of dmlA